MKKDTDERSHSTEDYEKRSIPYGSTKPVEQPLAPEEPYDDETTVGNGTGGQGDDSESEDE